MCASPVLYLDSGHSGTYFPPDTVFPYKTDTFLPGRVLDWRRPPLAEFRTRHGHPARASSAGGSSHDHHAIHQRHASPRPKTRAALFSPQACYRVSARQPHGVLVVVLVAAAHVELQHQRRNGGKHQRAAKRVHRLRVERSSQRRDPERRPGRQGGVIFFANSVESTCHDQGARGCACATGRVANALLGRNGV